MKVEMLKETNWGEKFRRVGDVVEVPDKVGKRWVNHKIAVSLELKKSIEPKELTVTELKEIAKGLQIEGYTKMGKAELTAAIEAKQVEIKKAEEEESELKELREQTRTFGFTSVETMTKDELKEAISLGLKIAEFNIEGAETMTKDELLTAIAVKEAEVEE